MPERMQRRENKSQLQRTSVNGSLSTVAVVVIVVVVILRIPGPLAPPCISIKMPSIAASISTQFLLFFFHFVTSGDQFVYHKPYE